MRQQAIGPLVESGQATLVKPSLTRREKLDILIARYAELGHAPLSSPKLIEWTPPFLLRFRKTDGTSLAPAVRALREAGENVAPNLKGVMDALQLSKWSLHSIACGCNHEDGMTTGIQLAREFETAKGWRPYT